MNCIVASKNIIAFYLLLLAFPTQSRAQLVTAIADTFISEHPNLGGSNATHGGDNELWLIGPSGNVSAPLFRFDLTAFAGRTVTSNAELRLNVIRTWSVSGNTQNNVSFHRVLVDWNEAAVSWNGFGPQPGLQAGIDYASSPLFTVSNLSLRPGDSPVFSLPYATVQSWTDNPSLNYGLIMISGETGPAQDFTFGVREFGAGATLNVTAQPSIVVTRANRYIGATGTSASTSLATDKVALLPGQPSTFANYTNYSRGLNGIVVDVNGLPSSTTNAQMLASLQFATWDGIAAGGFVALPGTVVPTVAIAAGGGAGGSARVNITFPDNAVQNTWFRVTVLANANTGLAANDVFYFGNVVGELDFGNTATRLRVNGQDAALLLANQSPGANSASVTNKFDLNRDGRVNGQDYAFLLANQQAAGIVAPITAP